MTHDSSSSYAIQAPNEVLEEPKVTLVAKLKFQAPDNSSLLGERDLMHDASAIRVEQAGIVCITAEPWRKAMEKWLAACNIPILPQKTVAETVLFLKTRSPAILICDKQAWLTQLNGLLNSTAGKDRYTIFVAVLGKWEQGDTKALEFIYNADTLLYEDSPKDIPHRLEVGLQLQRMWAQELPTMATGGNVEER